MQNIKISPLKLYRERVYHTVDTIYITYKLFVYVTCTRIRQRSILHANITMYNEKRTAYAHLALSESTELSTKRHRVHRHRASRHDICLESINTDGMSLGDCSS